MTAIHRSRLYCPGTPARRLPRCCCCWDKDEDSLSDWSDSDSDSSYESVEDPWFLGWTWKLHWKPTIFHRTCICWSRYFVIFSWTGIFKLVILMIIIIISSITNFPWLLNWWWGENLFPMIFRSPGSRLPTYSTPKPSTLDTQHTDLLPWTCWMWPGCDQDGAIDINLTWLFTESAWWFGCHQLYFPICIGIIIPIDELIFFGGVAQPPTRNK